MTEWGSHHEAAGDSLNNHARRRPADRDQERQRLAKEVEAWLAAGNELTHIPFGIGVNSTFIDWGKSTNEATPNTKQGAGRG